MAMHFILLVTFLFSTTYFQAEKLLYYPDNDRVVLIDSASVVRGNTTLKADSIVYKVSSKLLFAFKNVVLVVDKDTLTGDSLFYNLNTKQGVSFSGRTHVEKGFLSGEKMYKVTDSILHIENGKFTTCDLEPPHYFFYSREMKVIREDMAIVRPLVLYIHDLPVFYVPFWFFPVKKGRKSGFLTPHFGYNSILGKYFKNISYYWVLSNYADVTFTLNLTEKKGVQAGIDFVYKKYKRFDGNINFTIAQEFLPMKRRWSLRGNHIQNLPLDFKARAVLNFVSDKTYIEEYAENPTEWLKREMISYLSLSRRWKFASMNILLRDSRNLDTKAINTTLPDVTFTLFNRSIGNLSGSGNFRYIRYINGVEDSLITRSAADSRLSLAYPFSILKYISVNPSLYLEATIFDHDTAGNPNLFRGIYSTNLSISTTLYGYSKFGIGPIKRFRHTFRPSLRFSYTPDIDQSNIDPVNGYGPIPPRKAGTISIKNDWDAKLKSDKVFTLLSTASSISYDLLKTDKKFSNLGINFSLLPSLPIKINGSYSYNPYKGVITYRSYSVRANKGFKVYWEGDSSDLRKYQIYLVYTYYKQRGTPSSSRMDMTVSGNLTKNWKGKYSLNIDPTKFKIYEQSLELQRDLHCWAMSLRWWARADGSWDYDFKIWIKNLPDVKFKKSLFDLFLPH